MKHFLLSFILLAFIGTIYGQTDLTISYEIQNGPPTATVLVKIQNNSASNAVNIGAINLSVVYRTTGMAGDIANYANITNDEFDVEWPGSALKKVTFTEPLGSTINYDGIQYNGRLQYGNTDDNIFSPTYYNIPPATKITVMRVNFNVTGVVSFRMENESENLLNEIASDNPLVTYSYDVIPENNPFPVEWLKFEAEQMTNSFIKLDWETATETNNSHFQVERSTDNVLFSRIGRVEGSGTIDYNQQYEFLDSVPQAQTYYYRIRQVDFDGQYEYSETRQVELTDMNIFNLNIYPNPATDRLNISGQIEDTNGFTMMVTDLTGRILYQKDLTNRHDFKVGLNLRKFAPGIYNVSVIDPYGQSASSARFIKK